MDIWLATTGDYSDFSVRAAFTTKEDCEAWIAEQNAIGKQEYETTHGRNTYVTPFYSLYNDPERVDLDPPLPSLVKEVK